jgi:hypothetical protein
MALAIDDPDGDDEFADVKTLMMDVPNRLEIGAANTASPGFQTFTHDHAKMVASTYKSAKNVRFDVFDGNAGTFIASMPLPQNMVGTQPDLSKDDANLVFTVPDALTISNRGDHHFTAGSIYSASFTAATNQLGTPSALLTAAGQDTYYYPTFSPDGAWLALNHAGDTSATNNNNDAFYNRKARVQLLHFPPQSGDKPVDLAALNVADNLTNSYPRWSPFVQSYKNHKILWVTFSSNRDYGLHLVNTGFDNCYPPESPTYDQPQPLSKVNTTYANCAEPQIWMAAVVIDPDRSLDATDRSFPAFWLPFQDVNAHNHSAQWVEQIAPPQQDGGAPNCGNGPPCPSDQLCCVTTCQPSCVN